MRLLTGYIDVFLLQQWDSINKWKKFHKNLNNKKEMYKFKTFIVHKQAYCQRFGEYMEFLLIILIDRIINYKLIKFRKKIKYNL